MNRPAFTGGADEDGRSVDIAQPESFRFSALDRAEILRALNLVTLSFRLYGFTARGGEVKAYAAASAWNVWTIEPGETPTESGKWDGGPNYLVSANCAEAAIRQATEKAEAEEGIRYAGWRWAAAPYAGGPCGLPMN